MCATLKCGGRTGAGTWFLGRKVLLFTASDLREWRLVGEIAGHDVNGLANAGYMWECPDLFPLADTHLLI